MSKRYPGGIIRKTPQTPSQTSAQGIWDMASVTQAVKENTWPIAGVPDPISKSLRFRSSASAYLSRTLTTPTNNQKWTYSEWIKRGSLSSNQFILQAGNSVNDEAQWYFTTSDTIRFYQYTGSYQYDFTTAQVFRDPSAWYHLVVQYDSTEATTANRFRVYINGSQITLTTSTSVSLNATNSKVNSAVSHDIGGSNIESRWFDGYLAEINFIDGQALTPSSFGNTNDQTGVWQPIAYTGTYGTNGFYLPFSNTASTSTLGNDFSGNSNNWTTNNISLTSGSTYDSMVDVPTQWIPYNTAGDVGALWRGNYATFNPIGKSTVGTATASGGNLNIFLDRSSSNPWIQTTFALPNSGKWYFEFVQTAADTTSVAWTQIGVMNITTPQQTSVTDVTGQRAYRMGNGFKVTGITSASYGDAFALNDILGVAIDMDSGKMWFAKNNTWQVSGDPVAGTNATFTDLSGTTWSVYAGLAGQTTANGSINFGQQPFSYTPPSGFKTLNTTNLPTPTIGATASTTANKYFNANLYTGNGTTNAITNVGFQPDFVWVKSRSDAYFHGLYDAVRGAGSTKGLYSNDTVAEGTYSDFQNLVSFDSNGFTLGATSNTNNINANTSTFVGWNWKANGAGSTNTAGSITSTVSANTTAGFSIVTWTGPNNNTTSTVGHGLGVTPSMVIYKSRNSAVNWNVWCSSFTGGEVIYLNLTNGKNSDTNVFNNTAPSSTLLTVKNIEVNSSSMVAYCFAQVAGYSAFGSYTGNGSSDGPFIYTGFRPRFVMIKRTDSSDAWLMNDTSRSNYNGVNYWLQAESSGAESTNSPYQSIYLSNGFKLTGTSTSDNASGGTYIYMAFCESPFKFSLAR